MPNSGAHCLYIDKTKRLRLKIHRHSQVKTALIKWNAWGVKEDLFNPCSLTGSPVIKQSLAPRADRVCELNCALHAFVARAVSSQVATSLINLIISGLSRRLIGDHLSVIFNSWLLECSLSLNRPIIEVKPIFDIFEQFALFSRVISKKKKKNSKMCVRNFASSPYHYFNHGGFIWERIIDLYIH